MKKLGIAIALVTGSLLSSSPLQAQRDNQQGNGEAVITILPAQSGENVANVSQQDIKIKVNGKESSVTRWTPLRGPASPVELVILIDGSARSSLGEQFNDISTFVKEMPADAKIALAYMENGRAAMAGPLSSDGAQVLQGLHLSNGFAGSNGSPYFCLSDLAKNWPSKDTSARREVVMITDGVDNYQRRYDPDDPYVEAAIQDSVRAGLVVHSIYWHDVGRANSSEYETGAGQNLLLQVSQATGGKSYWEGTGNPVTFGPYFTDLRRRLRNQYSLGFSAPLKGKPEVLSLKLDLHVPSAKVESPQWVYVGRTAGGAGE